ncbi:hypothetical protein BD779DRAFT_1669476 [Infundibulicybe gibba]|nr:hypothetical protein BD779DRAFT_1669476 [Infundibulicybe gibba]
MDGPDDYFTDDLILDEQTLAVLDQAEGSYFTQNQPSNQPRSPLPISKRQKTVSGWKPSHSGQNTHYEDQEDLPEISVGRDGSYDVVHLGVPNSTRINKVTAGPFDISPSHSARGARLPETRPPTVAPGRPVPPSIQSSMQPMRNSYGRPTTNVVPRQTTQAVNRPLTRRKPMPYQQQEAQSLQNRFNELQEESIKLQEALKEATELRLRKEGEVSVLRKTMEKTAQDHSTRVAMLEAAKEEAIAKQFQIQQAMKAEMERLRTQFTFKQHELESSARKGSPSVLSRKASRGPPITPIRLPPGGTYGMQAEITSKRPLAPIHAKAIAKTSLVSRSPSATRMLPGFQNAFMTSTPARPLPTQNTSSGMNLDETRAIPYPSQFSIPFPPQLSPPSSPTDRAHGPRNIRPNKRDDLPGSLARDPRPRDSNPVDDDEDNSFVEELDNITLTNWVTEVALILPPFVKDQLTIPSISQMSYLILTHTFRSSQEPTLQILLGASLLSDSSSVHVEYSAASSRLLYNMTPMSQTNEYQKVAGEVCQSLVLMFSILGRSTLVETLIPFINLLTTLSYALPSFPMLLLSQSLPNNNSPVILETAHNIISAWVDPLKHSEQKDSIAREILSLLESLCYAIPDDLVGRFTSITSKREFLTIILHNKQPTWFLTHSVRLLVLLASCGRLFKIFLGIPDPEFSNQDHPPVDPSKNPYIEGLCSFLINTTRHDIEMLQGHILNFFAVLSSSGPEAHSSLVGSSTLIPSLILFLTKWTTPLWEDSESPVSTTQVMASIQIIKQALLLLHYLVFKAEPVYNLRHKLQHVGIPAFNGLIQTFIVTFGRLSYADPPNWMEPDGKAELVLLSETSRDLLDLVADGPEGDGIWAAYQDEEDEQVDEEEMEARLLDDDGDDDNDQDRD